MDVSGLQSLVRGLFAPTWISFICYGSVYYVGALILLLCLIPFRRSTPREIGTPKRILLIPTLISIGVGVSLPIVFRLMAPDAPSHVWECDSVILFFSAFMEKWSLWDFTKYVVIHKPGVLAASAHTLFWGAPTYAVMQAFGWNSVTFLSMSFVLGVGSLLLGFRIVKLLFNSGVAWCFVLIFAVNPSLIYNMGYGVAQTGTIFAVLLAVLFTFRALLSQGSLWLNTLFAVLCLFGATLNYGPGRVFVVTTLVFLAGVVVAALVWRRLDRRVTVAAFVVLVLASAALITENRLNTKTDFTSMRGEQAFHQHKYGDSLIRFLGDTPEVRALDRNNLPPIVRARFILASARFGLREFFGSFGPFVRLDVDRRGYGAGNEVKPYQSGLIIFIAIGFLIGLKNAVRSLRSNAADRALSHWFILAFFFIGLMPLLLVNRLDQHRSFILVFPLSVWGAIGLWACLRRSYRRGVPGLMLSGVAIALSLSLSASVWRIFAAREFRNPHLSPVMEHFTKIASPARVLGGAALICQEFTPLDFAMVNLSKVQPDISREFIHHLFLSHFSDQNLSEKPEMINGYLERYGSARAAFVSHGPLEKFKEGLSSHGLSVERTQFGDYYAWVVQP